MAQLIKEACVETLQQAVNAQKQGANRIELCSELDKEGLTPPLSLIKAVTEELKIPVKVMIRPREGNFVYSEEEIQQMQNSIANCKKHKVSGVVLGLLLPNKTIDIENTKRLVQLAKPLEVTFHKAIDFSADIIQSVKQLCEIKGVDAILTSGGEITAQQGVEKLNEMIEAAQGKLKIIAAGKVTSKNISKLEKLVQTNEFHGKRIVD